MRSVSSQNPAENKPLFFWISGKKKRKTAPPWQRLSRFFWLLKSLDWKLEEPEFCILNMRQCRNNGMHSCQWGERRILTESSQNLKKKKEEPIKTIILINFNNFFSSYIITATAPSLSHMLSLKPLYFS